jgi:shikimate kinase
MTQPENKNRFFLVGFMGVGKTTVGRDLAGRLGVPFYDLDELIEKHTGMEIQEIFLRKGEEAFRELETRLLLDLLQREPGVIATGGGTFARPENRKIIRSAGMSIWLDAPAELILRRGGLGEHRPLWGGPEKARALLEQRLPYYREADLRFDLEGRRADEAAEHLARILGWDDRT